MPEIRSWKLIPSPFKCSEYLVQYRDEVRACVRVCVCERDTGKRLPAL
jgi:hypothetical protein